MAWQLRSTEYTLVASVSPSEFIPGSPWLRNTTFPHKASSAEEFIGAPNPPKLGEERPAEHQGGCKMCSVTASVRRDKGTLKEGR